jgi:hypothetical protein
LHEEWIELALAIERIEVVAAADMLLVDEDLGDGAATVGAIGHLGSGVVVAVYFVFSEGNAFPFEQHFGANAVGAGLPGVDFDVGFHLLWAATQKTVEEV